MAFLDEELRARVASARILVVGAGGIGCELIKNLVLTGFSQLVVVDLDTIDVSNLNRQFLFQKQHVGRSKVEVARESALLFNPEANIRALHDSIISTEYGVDFFKQFSLVLNALDNKKARNHVNRLCLAAGVTLVESGSAGYLGQVSVIRKGVSECYECHPKPSPKSFPACTIRNTPSEPIHCVIWAKHLYNQLFGECDAENDVSPDTELIPANSGEEEMETEKNGKEHVSTRLWAERNEYDPVKLLEKLFSSDVDYLLTMDKLWQSRRPPTPLDLTFLPEEGEEENDLLPDQRLWSIRTCVQVFSDCMSQLHQRQIHKGELVWDKDCRIDLDFVVAASNLRATIFGIPRKSCFDIKSMAGNIVPAIATTNAVIAGLIVMEALKLLAGSFRKCRTTYLPMRPNPRKQFLVSCSLHPPNPKCYVCSPCRETSIKLNLSLVTLAVLRDKILIEHLGMVAPDAELQDGKGTILLSSEEGETDGNLPMSLESLGLLSGARLKVDDFLQDYCITVTLLHTSEHMEEEFKVVGDQLQGEAEEPTLAAITGKRKRVLSNEEDQHPLVTKKFRQSS